ncbi:MAG: hypothetical protein KDD91_09505, partial [Caldilinea sp.]|nr:hypothetical protein [Caldilinea sp.]
LSTAWEYGSGIASVATIDAFDAGVESGRVVYYIGTSGGALNAAGDQTSQSAASAAQNMAGGVYRSMARSYLLFQPLIAR